MQLVRFAFEVDKAKASATLAVDADASCAETAAFVSAACCGLAVAENAVEPLMAQPSGS